MKYLYLFTLSLLFVSCSSSLNSNKEIFHAIKANKNNTNNQNIYTIRYAKDIKFHKTLKIILYKNLSHERPKEGIFKLLYLKNGVLDMSFDISISKTIKKEKNPLQTLEAYSSVGFVLDKKVLMSPRTIKNANSLAHFGVYSAYPILTHKGEFLIGVRAPNVNIANEFKDIVIKNNNETLNYYKVYFYDKKGKLNNIIRMD